VNVWKLWPDGLATWTDDLQQLSGLCANRELLLEFYEQRTAKIERDGFDRHYEPGPKLGAYRTENWQSARPYVDLRHGQNATRSKRRPDEFRNPQYARGWREAYEIPGWGPTADILEMIYG